MRREKLPRSFSLTSQPNTKILFSLFLLCSSGGNDLTGAVGFLCDVDNIVFGPDDFPGTDCDITTSVAMLQLYDGLGVSSGYSSADPECLWVGVTCDSDNVVSIDLGENSPSWKIRLVRIHAYFD